MISILTTVTWLLGLLGSAVWIWLTFQLWKHRGDIQPLGDQRAEPPEFGWPSLALIFAGRNEKDSVESATRSMIAQDYPNLTIIAVNDRSTDSTGAILDRLASEEPKLRAIHVASLPAGWLGKNHALQQAANATDARWLLFTDADIHFEPGVLRQAVAFAESERLDHLVIAPDVVTKSIGERIFLAIFTLTFALFCPPWKIRDKRSRTSLGVGAFNLVRAEVFRAVGGFENLKLSVDDDVKLGQMLKCCGYQPALLKGLGTISVRWQVGVWGMIRGLEKNFFAALDFKLWRVAHGIAGLLVLGVFPFLGLFVGPLWARAICLLALLCVARMLREARGQNGLTWPLVCTLPIGTFFVIAAIVRSTALTLTRGGVRWRDHLYPLRELKAHVKERNAWLDEVWKSTR